MARLTLGSGSVSVTIDDGFSDLLRRALDHTIPGIVDRLEATADRIYYDAYNRWPVKTGTSRAALGREVQIAPDYSSIRARVYDTAPYAKYIKPKDLGGKSAFVELLRRPTEAAGAELVADIRDVIEQTLEGR